MELSFKKKITAIGCSYGFIVPKDIVELLNKDRKYLVTIKEDEIKENEENGENTQTNTD